MYFVAFGGPHICCLDLFIDIFNLRHLHSPGARNAIPNVAMRCWSRHQAYKSKFQQRRPSGASHRKQNSSSPTKMHVRKIHLVCSAMCCYWSSCGGRGLMLKANCANAEKKLETPWRQGLSTRFSLSWKKKTLCFTRGLRRQVTESIQFWSHPHDLWYRCLALFGNEARSRSGAHHHHPSHPSHRPDESSKPQTCVSRTGLTHGVARGLLCAEHLGFEKPCDLC